jgi:hypothetical protein
VWKANKWAPYVSECEKEEEEGNLVHTDIRYPSIRLTMGQSRLQTYIMAYFKHLQSSNGSGIIS